MQQQQRSKSNAGYVLVLSITSALGGFLFGYDTGVIAGAQLHLQQTFTHISQSQIEFVVSATILAAAFSSIFAGPLSDYLGRKPSIIIADILFIIGAILMWVSQSLNMLIVGRVFAGFGIGIASIVVPVYLSQCSPKQIRGMLVTVNVSFITGGQLIALIISIIVKQKWQISLGLSFVPAVLQLISILFLYESPSFLLKMKSIQFKQVIRKIYKQQFVKEAQRMYQQQVENMRDQIDRGFFQGIKLVKKYRRCFFIGISIQIIQQLCGINTIMYYGPQILQQSGLSKQPTYVLLSSLPFPLLNCIFSLVCLMTVDRIGRKRLLIITVPIIIVSLSMIVVGLILNTWIIYISMIIYMGAFGSGMSCIPWIINSQIYPLTLRGIGNSMATFANWITNFGISSIFLTSTETQLGRILTFSWLVVNSIGGLGVIYWFLPQTKQMSLQEVVQVVGYKEKVQEKGKVQLVQV